MQFVVIIVNRLQLRSQRSTYFGDQGPSEVDELSFVVRQIVNTHKMVAIIVCTMECLIPTAQFSPTLICMQEFGCIGYFIQGNLHTRTVLIDQVLKILRHALNVDDTFLEARTNLRIINPVLLLTPSLQISEKLLRVKGFLLDVW